MDLRTLAERLQEDKIGSNRSGIVDRRAEINRILRNMIGLGGIGNKADNYKDLNKLDKTRELQWERGKEEAIKKILNKRK